MHVSLDSALGRQRRLNLVGESVLQIAESPALGYSLRSLTGGDPKVVRVRRSSDNGEQDFTSSEINSGALVAYVGSGNNGFVSRWYDQLQQKDLANSSTSTQPQIVNNGAYSGYIDFNSNSQVLTNNSDIGLPASNRTFYQVLASMSSDSFNTVCFDSSFSFNQYWYYTSNALATGDAGASNFGTGAALTQGQFNQFSSTYDDRLETKKNNSAYFNVASSGSPPAAITGLTFGAGNVLGVSAKFRIKELVFDISNDDNVSSAIAQNQIAYFGTPN